MKSERCWADERGEEGSEGVKKKGKKGEGETWRVR